SFSMQLSGPAPEIDASSIGCAGFVHPGPHFASFWYRTTDRFATLVNFVVHWWPSPNCTGAAPSGELITNSPITDGAWHQLSGTRRGAGARPSAASARAAGAYARSPCPRPSTTGCSTFRSGGRTEHVGARSWA